MANFILYIFCHSFKNIFNIENKKTVKEHKASWWRQPCTPVSTHTALIRGPPRSVLSQGSPSTPILEDPFTSPLVAHPVSCLSIFLYVNFVILVTYKLQELSEKCMYGM